MSTNVERKKLRQETIEALFFPGDNLAALWTEEIERLAGNVNSTGTVNEVVDIVRTANLRRRVAQVRSLPQFEQYWNLLKYLALIKAVKMRSSGVEGISVSSRARTFPENEKEELIFVFETAPRPYRTITDISNLVQIIPRKSLLNLVGTFDKPPDESRFRIKRFPY